MKLLSYMDCLIACLDNQNPNFDLNWID